MKTGDIVKGLNHDNKMCVHLVLDYLTEPYVITRYFVETKLITELYKESELTLV
jgi:hypothetical protein